jgi:hypothetical protein
MDHLAREIFEENHQAAHFDPSRGGAGTAADKHHSDDEDAREVRPLVVVRGDKSGGGADGNNCEGRVTQGCGGVRRLRIVEQTSGHGQGHDGEDTQIEARFFILFPFAPSSGNEPSVEHEADSAQDHEEDDPPLHGRALVEADACVACAEPPG